MSNATEEALKGIASNSELLEMSPREDDLKPRSQLFAQMRAASYEEILERRSLKHLQTTLRFSKFYNMYKIPKKTQF